MVGSCYLTVEPESIISAIIVTIRGHVEGTTGEALVVSRTPQVAQNIIHLVLDSIPTGNFRPVIRLKFVSDPTRLLVGGVPVMKRPDLVNIKQLIRTCYLGHVIGYQPIKDQYLLVCILSGFSSCEEYKNFLLVNNNCD